MTVRGAAQQVAVEIAARLADTDQVLSVVTARSNLDHPPGMPPRSPWSPLSLSDGHPGLALLFAEFAHGDTRYRAHAHAHLAAAGRALVSSPSDGLFAGLPAVAFAARCAQQTPDDYSNLLRPVEERLTAGLRARLTAEAERLDAGMPGMPGPVYDVIGGICGLGRYLLNWAPAAPDLLMEILAYLVRLTDPVSAHGHVVPGWWVRGAPSLGQQTHYPRGHFNLGLAHGIPGVLALLALASEAGAEVEGQSEAITRIAEWVLGRQIDDYRWPAAIPFDAEAVGAFVTESSGPGWCYGTAGVARALFVAGRALDRADWQRTAIHALSGAVRDTKTMSDFGLCHGWAGLLHIAWRTTLDSGDQALADHLPELVNRIVEGFDSTAPFGYRSDDAGGRRGPHRAGFLEGAAGIALALHSWASGSGPASPWETALMLS